MHCPQCLDHSLFASVVIDCPLVFEPECQRTNVPARRFPENFLWGCATSAYQIEGSTLADGAGPNIWQRFSRTPGRVANNDNGDVACDHYRRFDQDVELMQQM